MKRKVLLMAGLVAVLGVSNAAGALAAENTGEGAASNATVGFDNENGEDGGGGITPPVDPEEPDTDIEPDDKDDEEGGSTGNTGDLRIDYVSNFRFGSHKIGAGTQTLYAKTVKATAANGERIDVPNYVQLTDLRGTGAGWNLTVSQDGQFESADGDLLNGAQLKITNIQTASNNENGPVAVPADHAITLIPGGSKDLVIRAEEGTGYGTHIAHFGTTRTGDETSGAKSVILEIPGSTTILQKVYKTSLTWTLSDTPGGNYGGIGIDIDDQNEFEEGVDI